MSSFLVFFLLCFLPHLFYHVVLKVRHCKGSEPNNNDNIHTHTTNTTKIYKHAHPGYLSLYCAHVRRKQLDHTTFSVTSSDAPMHPISHSSACTTSTCTNTQCTIPARMRKCVLHGTVAPVPTHFVPYQLGCASASYIAQWHLNQHTVYHTS